MSTLLLTSFAISKLDICLVGEGFTPAKVTTAEGSVLFPAERA